MHEPVSKIRLIVNLFLTLEVCLGITLIVVTIVYQHILESFMTAAESKMLPVKFCSSYVLGFQLIASYLCSIFMWSKLWQRRFSNNVQLLLRVWLFFCFLIIVCCCATIWTLLTNSDDIAASAETILYNGIDIYYMDPEWKLLWDKLQYTKKCCGVNGYQDWIHATWMTTNLETFNGPIMTARDKQKDLFDYHLSNQEYEMLTTAKYADISTTPKCGLNVFDSDFLLNREESSTLNKAPNDNGEETLAPYTCCKHDSVSCYENYVPISDESSRSIPHLKISEINTDGCLFPFIGELRHAMNILSTVILSAILVNIIIFCLTKYLMITNNNLRGYTELNNDISMSYDNANGLVLIKCPPNVKCVALEEQNASDSDIPYLLSDTEPCLCCVENNDERSRSHDRRGKDNNYIIH